MACCHIALQCPLNEPGSGRFLSPSFRLDDNGILWAATGGGVIAWDLASGDAYGYTVLDGLPANDVHTVVVCPIPEPSIIVGTDEGMALYDPASDMWDRWTEDNSGLESNEVDTLDCDPDNNTLGAGHCPPDDIGRITSRGLRRAITSEAPASRDIKPLSRQHAKERRL